MERECECSKKIRLNKNRIEMVLLHCPRISDTRLRPRGGHPFLFWRRPDQYGLPKLPTSNYSKRKQTADCHLRLHSTECLKYNWLWLRNQLVQNALPQSTSCITRPLFTSLFSCINRRIIYSIHIHSVNSDALQNGRWVCASNVLSEVEPHFDLSVPFINDSVSTSTSPSETHCQNTSAVVKLVVGWLPRGLCFTTVNHNEQAKLSLKWIGI